MGRTTPTYRDAIRDLESEWEPMGRALRYRYRSDFDRLFDRARGFADAAGYANPTDPERALVVSVLLAHEVELRRLRERVGSVPEAGSAGTAGGRADGSESAADGPELATDEPESAAGGPGDP